jgi:ribosome biogenesis GTPase / thiamine phosphate phosphatase
MAKDAARDSSKAGLVIAAHGRRGLLEAADGTTLNYMLAGRRLRAYCGDVASYAPAGRDEPVLITAVGERRNELRRQPGRGQEAETIATNITHLVVVLAGSPEPDLFVTDRYLCAAQIMGAAAAIAWNKADLNPELPPEIALYAQLGLHTLPVSANTGAGLAALMDWFGSGTGVLVGQSGVGKSSLLNRLAPGSAAATGSLSGSTEEGRHTTTASAMHRLPGGARLIDTPGVRDFVPALPNRREIAQGFSEIAQAGAACRFIDCSHLREPGCAVQAALEQGLIDARRFESYRRLMNLESQATARTY